MEKRTAGANGGWDRRNLVQFAGKNKPKPKCVCVCVLPVSLKERSTAADLHIYRDSPLSDGSSDSASSLHQTRSNCYSPQTSRAGERGESSAHPHTHTHANTHLRDKGSFRLLLTGDEASTENGQKKKCEVLERSC